MAYEKKESVVKKNKVAFTPNISHYKNYECVLLMKKAKSPVSVGFYLEPGDPYMINLVSFKTKTGVIVHEAQIIEPDLPNHTRSWEKDGFVKY